MMKRAFLEILERLPLAELKRIDVALEGDWSSTVSTIWTRQERLIGFSKVTRGHKTFRPSLELYFDGMWLGVHCFKRVDDENIFDEQLALNIVRNVDSMLNE